MRYTYPQIRAEYAKARKEKLDGESILKWHLERANLNRSQAEELRKEFANIDGKPLANRSPILLKGLAALPPRQFIIKRLQIEAGTLALLCASGGSSKSWLLTYVACCVASGKRLFGEWAVEKGPVAHIDQEMSEIQTQRRYERLAAGMGLSSLDVERLELTKRLDSPEAIQTCEEELTRLFTGKRLVCIDSLKATSEADENTSQIEKVLKIFKRVAGKTGCAILLVHHKGKNNGGGAKQTGRGHSSIYDSVDIQIDLDWDLESETAEMVCRKNRDGRLFQPISYRLLDTGSHNADQDCSECMTLERLEQEEMREEPFEEKILRYLATNGETNQSTLFFKLGGDRNLYKPTLDKLVTECAITVKRGAKNACLYEIASIGLARIEWKE